MMTIEFRQHAGTLDPAEIRAWIDVVVSVVQHAHYASEANFKDSLRDWLSPNCYSIDVLKGIGCSAATTRFYKDRLEAVSFEPSHNMDLFQQDLDELDLFQEENMIAPLLAFAETKQVQRLDPAHVRKRINEKFRLGGYGQFTREYLDQVEGIDEELREKLAIR